jgi:uncharacterized protein YbbK (DUF523 family)
LRTIFVSACLLGVACRYDGGSKPIPQLANLLNDKLLIIPFCPEVQGGLSIPRPPVEITGGDGNAVLEGKAKALSKDGEDVSAKFIRGAEVVYEMAVTLDPELVVLKSYSPSCGMGWIYDGNFSGKLKPGYGVTATRLKQGGFKLYTEDDFLKRINCIKSL